MENEQRLRNGLAKAADTFHDIARVLDMLGLRYMAAACQIAENSARDTLSKEESK